MLRCILLFGLRNNFHLSVFSILKEQHIPESVGDVSKMSEQSITSPLHSHLSQEEWMVRVDLLRRWCSATPGKGEQGRAEYLTKPG